MRNSVLPCSSQDGATRSVLDIVFEKYHLMAFNGFILPLKKPCNYCVFLHSVRVAAIFQGMVCKWSRLAFPSTMMPSDAEIPICHVSPTGHGAPRHEGQTVGRRKCEANINNNKRNSWIMHIFTSQPWFVPLLRAAICRDTTWRTIVLSIHLYFFLSCFIFRLQTISHLGHLHILTF